jgi:exonuclease VII small subunit
MMKHVGLYNAQKVTVVLHKMPSEEHMCLVLMDQKVPPRYYQAVQACLNSPAGQEAKDLATALDTVNLEDGRQLARVLYAEGHLKKVPTNQVFMTPFGFDANNKKIRLNELNDMMGSIEQGGDALQKLKDFDEGKGLKNKTKSATASDAPINAGVPNKAEGLVPSSLPVTSDPQLNVANVPIDPRVASVELYAQGENLRTIAAQLLQQAKALAIKAEQIYPSAKKKLRGRPKGSGLKSLTK